MFWFESFLGRMKSVHVVNYFNYMGGTHSIECNSAAKDIWQFCIEIEIWIIYEVHA